MPNSHNPARAPRRFVTIGAALLALVGLTSTACQSDSGQTRPSPQNPVNDSDKAAPIFLWEVTTSAPGRVFLYGSMHFRKNDSADLPKVVQALAARADNMVFEVHPDEMSSTAIQALTLRLGLLQGQTLDQVVAPDVYAKVTQAAEKTGLPMMALDRMRPWFAALTLDVAAVEQSDLDREHGIEYLLQEQSEQRDPRPTYAGLETAESQLNIFAKLSDSDATQFLDGVAEGILNDENQVDELSDAYARGDAEAMEALIVRERAKTPEFKALYEALLEKRNVGMAEGLTPFLQSDQITLVTIGCAHLLGQGSVIELLTTKGFKVDQIAPGADLGLVAGR